MKYSIKNPGIVLYLIDTSGIDTFSTDTLKFLSRDEILRADKLESNVKKSFLAGRASLRIILSKFLGTESGGITFSNTNQGKPEISGEYSESFIKFNTSHSGAYILTGISLAFEIGVDIQEIRAITSPERLMRRQLTNAEYERISVLEDGLRVNEFFRYWTRKEAVLKASGIGLLFPMNKIDVSLITSRQSSEVLCDGLSGSFFVSDIEIVNNYTASVALEGSLFDYRLIKLSFKDILDNKFTV